MKPLFLTLLAAILSPALALATTPISVTFATDFVGYDGQWSPAQIRVGTDPEQWLLLLPTTLSSETWVVGPGGCDLTQTCRSRRGGIFYANQSATWDALGYFELGYNTLSQTNSIGQYGLDQISLSDTFSAKGQAVAIVNSTDIWDGSFGLGVEKTRYNDNVDHLSFLSTLVQNLSLIPSHSYGYTAGACYAEKGIVGSLTLGGVDTTRYQSNNSTFTLGSTYEPVLTVRSIQVASGSAAVPPNWSTNPLPLLTSSNQYVATIDTSTPFLWMPVPVCDAFAAALNLTYDQNLQLYTFSGNSSPTTLSNWNLSFTFSFANSASSQPTYSIPISYEAFNLQLSYPFPSLNATAASSPINYFPIRRAKSTSQYTIGRMFLQESYMAVDYERGNFALMPAAFPNLNVVSPDIMPISRPAGSTWPGPSGSGNKHSLPTDVKLGIEVGIGLVVMLALIVACCLWTKKRLSAIEGPHALTKMSKQCQRCPLYRKYFCKGHKQESCVPELMADKDHPQELRADESNTRYEIGGIVPFEMPATEVSSEYYQARLGVRASAIPRNNPERPAELAPIVDIAKGGMLVGARERKRSESPVPPYSPSDNSHSDQANTNSISPTSQQHDRSFGSHSSGAQGVSPISPLLNGTFDQRDAALRGRTQLSDGTVSQGSTSTTSSGSATKNSAAASTQDQSGDEHGDIEQQTSGQPLRRRFSWEE